MDREWTFAEYNNVEWVHETFVSKEDAIVEGKKFFEGSDIIVGQLFAEGLNYKIENKEVIKTSESELHVTNQDDKFNEILSNIENLITQCQDEDAITNLHRARLFIMDAWDNNGIGNYKLESIDSLNDNLKGGVIIMIARFLDIENEKVTELGDFTVIASNEDVLLSEEYHYDISLVELYESIKSKYNSESLISVLDYGDEIRAVITIEDLDYGYVIIKH